MKKLLLGLALWLGALTPSQAVVQQTNVGDVAYTILASDCNVQTTTALTAARTWTLPPAAATQVGQTQQCPISLQITDNAGGISQPFPLTIAPQSGETINGNAANLTLSAAGASITLIPTSGSNWKAYTSGDSVSTGLCTGTAVTATVTITIATPGVVTWTAHGFTGACPVVFTTSGALPTGLTAGTTYWVVSGSITANTFQVATTVANALAGTAIATSGTQSGVQTGTAGSPLTTATAANVTGLSLTQGEWNCWATVSRVLGATTSMTLIAASISQTSATMATQGSTGFSSVSTAANVIGATGFDTKIGPDRQSLTATTNVFLVARDTFTVSTDGAYGNLTCRRMR